MKRAEKKPRKNSVKENGNKDSNESFDTWFVNDWEILSKEEQDRWDEFDEENERLFGGCFEF